MAFVPGYDHDIFISYAHVDDEPLDASPGPEQPAGWVERLYRHVEKALARRIGRPEAFHIWFDRISLRGRHSLTEEIAEHLKRSATFVALLSPGYCASTWCRDEAALFASHFAGRLRNRLFVIEMARVEDLERPPPELSGLRNYRCWYPDRTNQPCTLAMPGSQADMQSYFALVQDVARDIHAQLKEMGGRLPEMQASAARPLAGSIVAPPPTDAPSVVLAEVTDDLELRRLEVRRYLEQQGVPVLPAVGYPLGRAQFEAALDADLAQAGLFVQLLGPMPGKRPPDVPDGYGWLQLECARRHAGTKVLLWRSPETDPAQIEWPRHRELLELPGVQATSLEAFKAAIAAALKPAPPPSPPRGNGDRALVFLNTEPRHQGLAAEIRAAIGNAVDWATPLFEGPAEIVREDLEQNLLDCDAMVMVYADNAGWARAQLRQFRKLSARRERPVRAIPVIDAPPSEKPELGFYLPEMVVIDGRSGIGSAALAQLSESLRL
jgi:hypothetical protein